MALSACTADGSVRIVVDTPVAAELSPVDERLVTVAMTIEAEGMPPAVTTRPAAGHAEGLDLGQVPIADGVRLSLSALNGAGRLIGFGRSPQVDVRLGDDLEVTIRLRRPFGYVAGGSTLAVFDPTIDPGQAYLSSVGLSQGAPVAAVPSPDGNVVAVLVPGQLVLLSTSDHAALDDRTIPIEAGAVDLAISTDSQWIAMAHGGGVSLTHLGAALDGAGGAVFLPLGSAGAITSGSATAYALMGAALTDACGASSSVQPVDLASQTALDAIPLGFAARDIAVDPASGAIFLAVPCRSAVVRLDPGGKTPFDLLPVSNPTSVAVAAGRVWAIGHVDTSGGAHLILASAALDGSNPTLTDLDVPDERARAFEFQQLGQAAEVRIQADETWARDLAVLPDGSRVAILAFARYAADQSQEEFFPGTPIIPAILIETWEYQLLDVSGSQLQRMRTDCYIENANNGFLTDFSCTQSAGQDLAPQPFIPTHVGVLYGER